MKTLTMKDMQKLYESYQKTFKYLGGKKCEMNVDNILENDPHFITDISDILDYHENNKSFYQNIIVALRDNQINTVLYEYGYVVSEVLINTNLFYELIDRYYDNNAQLTSNYFDEYYITHISNSKIYNITSNNKYKYINSNNVLVVSNYNNVVLNNRMSAIKYMNKLIANTFFVRL